jgi:bifunctional N-acetylglucosamine-1-phosphate-uridyltransferase/glucosamine-1-phosphate-acetyltransferase GlmU-like protein
MAAGKGTRMKSDKAKVLHELKGKPLLHYSIEAAKEAGAEKIVAIIGHQADFVRKTFADSGCVFVEQKPQLGTVTLFCRQKMLWLLTKGLRSFFAAMCRF